MATLINFAGGSSETNGAVLVEEDVDAVYEAMNAANGLPFALTHARLKSRVYVNPETIAYWHERQPARAASF